ncbi:hypothetical protein OEV82_09140 [Caldibacillus thermolactis]|jgi:5'-3' exonuclease|uniref:Helix-hairpin-helix domain-containing protein n=1 Tax=Pallidibacillus thermolactis TaxID=251051 RepID=A0ABT2WGG5_9BACI|nr:hypothetical protein [Pallidibacillus thermolactis]MCU9594620.1 hypothetical protein [Pallidibacillus thermolactis]
MSKTMKKKKMSFQMNGKPSVKQLEAAYQLGLAKGEEIGINKATNFFKKRFDGIYDVPGIGEKTVEKLVKHFGKEYFEKVEK